MKRSYLFLQGPHGPFFKQLGRRLRAGGSDVLRVNFNGGDWIDWHGPECLSYTGSQYDWPDYVADLCQRHRITDLVVFGDCRSLHRIAIEQSKAFGIQVHAFEEGYFRPDWITLEEGGVNGYSCICSRSDWHVNRQKKAEEAPVQEVGPSMRWILFYCIRYYLAKSFWSYRFRRYIRHRPYRPYQESLLWLSYFLHMPLLRWRSRRRRQYLHRRGNPYFLVCLQLDTDAQLRVHSDYLSVAEVINRVLRSFTADAPKDSLLVFKQHPLDPGAISYETLVRLEAYSAGIRDRVVFLHMGNLPELMRDSQGVIVVNSTAGTSALHHGKPTITLGKAVYDIPGLTWQGGLERFWTDAGPPDRKLYQEYRSCLTREVLVNGGFFNPRGRKLALEGVLRKFQTRADKDQPINQPNKVASLRKATAGDRYSDSA